MKQLSDNALRFGAAWETFSPLAYRATSKEKYLTIGYGHYGADVRAGQRISEPEAMELLRKDYQKAVDAVNAVASPKLNQAQFDAVCDLVFNAGAGVIAADTGTGAALRGGYVEALRAKLSRFFFQQGKPLLGLKRRVEGRLALFDGDSWREAERKGRAVKSL